MILATVWSILAIWIGRAVGLHADNGEELLVGNAGPKAGIRLLGIRHRQGPCCL